MEETGQDTPKTEQKAIFSENISEADNEIIGTPYTAKSIVLAKVKGYPPWPAMVLDYNLLPENIKTKKPKTVKQTKNLKAVSVLPVRFFSDDTYIWIKDSDIKPLTQEQITEYLEKEGKRKRRDNLLKFAYELANSPPDMELFIKWGSKGEPEFVPEPEPEKEEEVEEPVTKKQKVKAKPGPKPKPKPKPKAEPKARGKLGPKSGSKVTTKVAEVEEKKGRSGSKSASTKSAAVKAAPVKKVVKVEADPYDGYDSDWGLNEAGDKEDNVYQNSKQQKEFETQFPNAAEINEEFKENSIQIHKIRDKLCNLFLIEETVKESDISKELKKLKSLNPPSSLIKSTQLNKLLIAVLRRPVEKFEYNTIRKDISGLLGKWFELEIRPNDSEELRTPETSGSGLVSRNSEAPEIKDETNTEIVSNGA